MTNKFQQLLDGRIIQTDIKTSFRYSYLADSASYEFSIQFEVERTPTAVGRTPENFIGNRRSTKMHFRR